MSGREECAAAAGAEMKKPYRLGIVVGRFQTFHNGHRQMIAKAVELCDEVGVFIGSSQEAGTVKNPFDYETRKRLIGSLYGETVRIYPLPDIGVGNNARWGAYVLEQVTARFSEPPDLMISGKEERRIDWFDGVEGVSVAELYVPKTIDISATRMRSFFLENDFESFRAFSPEEFWPEFAALREIVLAAQANPETASI